MTSQDRKSEKVKINQTKKSDPLNREEWANKLEFVLASVGLAVGLGNIWRFPYLCQKNGGGAFLIPYFIMMIIEGLPLFLLELVMGQRQRTSALGVWWNVHPAFFGIGIASMIVSMFLCLYYIVVMAWSFQYIFASFAKTLPWSPQSCKRYKELKLLQDRCALNESLYQSECNRAANFTDCCVNDAPTYYFYRKALNISPSIDMLGDGLNWELFGCLLLAWMIVYVCIVRGIKSSGKVAYVTATAPYIILFTFFCYALTLDGAASGIKVLFEPDFSQLSNPDIWLDAASQMFFTLNLGFGAVLSFSSYLPVKNNCMKDGYVIVLINCATSLFAGVVVFAILGHRAHVTGNPITQISNGPGLVFITFCDAFLQLPVPQLWSILFFSMLVFLGIDSQFGILEGFIAPFYDMKLVKMRKEIFTGIIAILFFTIGVGMVTSSGYFAFQIFDNYSLSIGLLLIALFQTLAVSWVYGNNRIADDIEYMTGRRPSIFWLTCWKYISPTALVIIVIASGYKLASQTVKYDLYVGCINQMVNFSPLSKGVRDSIVKYPYPAWASVIIALFIVMPIAVIVGYLVKDLVKNPSKWKSGIKNKFSSWTILLPDDFTNMSRTYENLDTLQNKENNLEKNTVSNV